MLGYFLAGATVGLVIVGGIIYGVYFMAHFNQEIADGLNQAIRGDR